MDNNDSQNNRSGNQYTNNSCTQSRSAERNNKENRLGKKPNPNRKKLIIAISAVVVVLLAIFGVYKWMQAKKAADSIFSSADIQKARDVSDTLKQGKPISILLLGTDTGALGRNFRGRTDTIIVATLNPKKEKMTLTSIPRDTAISIPGYTDYAPSKINAAYDLGGAGTTIKAVQQLLNIPIDFYGLINMGGLEKIVDGVGGIDVTPKLTFKYGNADVKKGEKIHLEGAAALDYSRMRHDDPLGDYGRQTRQRQVLMAVLRKSDSATALLNQKFMDSLQKQTQTDLTFDDLLALSTKYRVATHHLKSTHLQGVGTVIGGGDYEVAQPDEMERVTKFIRDSLDLEPAKTGTSGLDGGSSNSSQGSSSSDATGNAATAQQSPAPSQQQDNTQQQTTTNKTNTFR
ncbi:LCP family protein [Pediococcus argentinicus]|uniref:LCP family protein n=1 Tax=Pediococcus argentinicus TaxID=480391 RepID=UPI00338DA546